MIGGNLDHALMGHPLSGQFLQALKVGVGDGRAFPGVKTQLNRRFHLVDVLTAGACGPDKLFLDLIFG